MKPKPFLLLNHLIIPWGMQKGLVVDAILCARGGIWWTARRWSIAYWKR